ncbi:hypothetical protein D6827_02460 [Candidatus Parcubacteria bacterium]|nr:MAG: hypothetical protein D6827_02460 [Candidatus Parcubacteria bacterium]
MLGANRTISTYRLSTTGNISEYSSSATMSDIDVYLESIKPELDMVLDVKAGIEAYYMYADPDELTDILVGDKVVDDQNNTYYVQGIKRHEDNLDSGNVLRILLNKEKDR